MTRAIANTNKGALQKFMKNYWGVASFMFIIFCVFLAVFAYLIAPDSSKFANNGELSLANKPMGFSVQVIEVLPQEDNHWNWVLFGKTNPKMQIPISSYQQNAQTISYQTYSELPELSVEKTLDVGQLNYQIKNKTFWLGTDSQGRDYLSRLIVGARISISIGFVSVGISLVIGLFFGAISGYYGGKIDAFVLWFINVVWSIPTLLLVIAITLALGKGFWQVFIAVGLTMWVEIARVVRGQVISLKEQSYITAARALGFSNWRIIRHHILPNIMAPVIVICAANFASAILIESGLSFLGLGAQMPIPSWGGMIKENYNAIILGKAYLAILPGIFMCLLVLAFMMIGNTLRDVFDVKS